MEKIKTIFYGTAEFAIPSLRILCENGLSPMAVVTAPDKASGRGLEVKKSEVKIAAEELGLEVLQPTNMKSDSFLETIKSLNPDLQIIVAFRMMPERIWSYPRYGSINLHASLLPQYRGAAPIHWAIINGEKETGVTTFFLRHEIDTGDIIAQQSMRIEELDTLGSMYEKLKRIGADLLLKTVLQIQEGNVDSVPQTLKGELRHAPKITKSDSEIDWNKTARQVYNLVRGTNPFPGAWTELNSKKLKVHQVRVNKDGKLVPGQIETHDQTEIEVGCSEGSVFLEVVQPENKRKMKVEDFLRGNTL